MNDQTIEQEIQAKGLTAPRVMLSDIEANITSEFYFTAEDGVMGAATRGPNHLVTNPLPLQFLTFCVLVLRNGFTVTGESACASPDNFDAELGRKIARQNAFQKVWPLMGYALKEQLYRDARGDTNTFEAEQNTARLELVRDLVDLVDLPKDVTCDRLFRELHGRITRKGDSI